jgi:hypothetical protein
MMVNQSQYHKATRKVFELSGRHPVFNGYHVVLGLFNALEFNHARNQPDGMTRRLAWFQEAMDEAVAGGVLINTPSLTGYTALQAIALQVQAHDSGLQVLDILLDKGADPTHRTPEGKTVEDLLAPHGENRFSLHMKEAIRRWEIARERAHLNVTVDASAPSAGTPVRRL